MSERARRHPRHSRSPQPLPAEEALLPAQERATDDLVEAAQNIDSAAVNPGAVLKLQQAVGNRAVQQLLNRQRQSSQTLPVHQRAMPGLLQRKQAPKTKKDYFDQLHELKDTDLDKAKVAEFQKYAAALKLTDAETQYSDLILSKELWQMQRDRDNKNIFKTKVEKMASDGKDLHHVETTINVSKDSGSVALKAYFFPGTSKERALIFAGQHGTEQSGAAVVEDLLTTLKSAKARPYFQTILIPSLFPDNATVNKAAHAKQLKKKLKTLFKGDPPDASKRLKPLYTQLNKLKDVFSPLLTGLRKKEDALRKKGKSQEADTYKAAITDVEALQTTLIAKIDAAIAALDTTKGNINNAIQNIDQVDASNADRLTAALSQTITELVDLDTKLGTELGPIATAYGALLGNTAYQSVFVRAQGASQTTVRKAGAVTGKLNTGISTTLQAVRKPFQLMKDEQFILSGVNEGRVTKGKDHLDPNRQAPKAGEAYDPTKPPSKMEEENQVLFELIARFKPSRIASVHAIHSDKSSGYFVDPRARKDQASKTGFTALDQAKDLNLIMAMAHYAQTLGAMVGSLKKPEKDGSITVNVKYKEDEPWAHAGDPQSKAPRKGGYTTTGTWASTEDSSGRKAATIITVEVAQGYRPEDLIDPDERAARQKEIKAHSAAIQKFFLTDPNNAKSNADQYATDHKLKLNVDATYGK